MSRTRRKSSLIKGYTGNLSARRPYAYESSCRTNKKICTRMERASRHLEEARLVRVENEDGYYLFPLEDEINWTFKNGSNIIGSHIDDSEIYHGFDFTRVRNGE